jgi:hypothetical protein
MLEENRRDALVSPWHITGASILLCATLLLASSSPGGAQTQTPPALQTPDVNAKPSEAQKAPSSSLPSSGENASETLGRSGGVIKPPGGVDAGISVPPKDSGAGSAMPVIPPPGSPGGSQNVQPK